MKELILDHQKIAHTIRRIAFQILETYSDESEIVIAGIQGSGSLLAEKIAIELKKIDELEIKVVKVSLDKHQPGNQSPELDIDTAHLKDKAVVLVDDVLNSGATLMHGCLPFLHAGVKKLKTAVLVNRNHKKFPIKADFKGLSLSTSSYEHIEVVFEENNDRAYLK